MKNILLTIASFALIASCTAQKTTAVSDTTAVIASDTIVKKKTIVKNNELPDIELKDIDGNRVNIKALGDSGKITIITFWATWCKPCIKELNNTLDLIEDWKKDYNVQYYAVSVDDSKTTNRVKPFAAALGYVGNYTVLLDPNKDLARTMNVNNPPMIFVYDETGKMVYSHMGYTEGGEFDVDDKLKEMNGVVSDKKKKH